MGGARRQAGHHAGVDLRAGAARRSGIGGRDACHAHVVVGGGGQDAAAAHAPDGVVPWEAGQLAGVLVPAEDRSVGKVSRWTIGGRGGVWGLGKEGGVRGMVRMGVRRGWVGPVQDRVRGMVTLTVILHVMGVKGGEGAM